MKNAPAMHPMDTRATLSPYRNTVDDAEPSPACTTSPGCPRPDATEIHTENAGGNAAVLTTAGRVRSLVTEKAFCTTVRNPRRPTSVVVDISTIN